jgi:outer membrane immunogenic protein
MRTAFLTASAALLALTAAPAFAQSPRPGAWQGVYVGGTVGGAMGKVSRANTSGLTGNVHVGVNGQFDRVVVGVEADAGVSSNRHSSFNSKIQQGVNGTMRVRAGVTFDRVLVYGTGGIAVSNFSVSGNSQSRELSRGGTVIGAGAEVMLTDNIAARGEYLRYDFSKTNLLNAGGTANATPNSNVLRGGLSYRF